MEVIVTLSSEDKHYEFDRLSIDFDSTDEEVLNAIAPILLEEEGFDIDDAEETFTIKRSDSSQTIYVFPKSTAGK